MDAGGCERAIKRGRVLDEARQCIFNERHTQSEKGGEQE